MGSFNTSCFVSRQTIASGDECMVIPITQQSADGMVDATHQGMKLSLSSYTHSTCYPNRFWSPVGMFLEAQYDDCGRVTLHDTPANRTRLLNYLRLAYERVPNVAQGDNPYHDVACDLAAFMSTHAVQLLERVTAKPADEDNDAEAVVLGDELFAQAVACWDYVFGAAESCRAFWLPNMGGYRPHAYAVVHRAAYDELMGKTSSWKGYNDESWELRSYFSRLLASLEAVRAEVDADKARTEAALAGVSEEQAKSLRLIAAIGGSFPINSLISDINIGSFSSFRYNGEREALQKAFNAYVAGKVDEQTLFELVRPWLEERYVNFGLEMLNLHYEPIVYAPQDYSNEIGTGYAGLVAKVCAQVTSARRSRSLGPLLEYSISVKTVQAIIVFSELAAHAEQWGCQLTLSHVAPDEREGHVVAHFRCTLAPSDLEQALQAFRPEDDGGLVLCTLKQLNAQALASEEAVSHA